MCFVFFWLTYLYHSATIVVTINFYGGIMKPSRVKFACYASNVSMAVVANLSPILFLTFRSLYGLSYTLLGLLIVINFVTQLLVDLVFSFFSHKFNIQKTVRAMPILTLVGFIVYAVWPVLMPSTAYVGLVIGTIIFSAASGLNEVLISPIIAALPSKDPDREMSALHSVYAWAVAGNVVISTLFLMIFGRENWFWLVILLMIEPLLAIFGFFTTDIPKMETPEKVSGALSYFKNGALWLCVLAIFFGGATECTMAQWSSSYLEQALGIPKVYGDVFGVALFGLFLAIGRTLYAKRGKNIQNILLFGSIGAFVCYFVAIISPSPLVALIACAITGLCVSMLWPGSLVVASDTFKTGGVFIYAVMAAGGDLGASIAPQLVGIVTDAAMNNSIIGNIASEISLSAEQLGMKLGLATALIFPLVSIIIFSIIKNKRKSKEAQA